GTDAGAGPIAAPGVVVEVVEDPGGSGLRIHDHGPAVLVVRRAHESDRERAVAREQREAPPHLGGRLRGAGEIALRPRDLARLSAQDREAPLLLGVAYLGPAGDLLRVGGLGHV